MDNRNLIGDRISVDIKRLEQYRISMNISQKGFISGTVGTQSQYSNYVNGYCSFSKQLWDSLKKKYPKIVEFEGEVHTPERKDKGGAHKLPSASVTDELQVAKVVEVITAGGDTKASGFLSEMMDVMVRAESATKLQEENERLKLELSQLQGKSLVATVEAQRLQILDLRGKLVRATKMLTDRFQEQRDLIQELTIANPTIH